MADPRRQGFRKRPAQAAAPTPTHASPPVTSSHPPSRGASGSSSTPLPEDWLELANEVEQLRKDKRRLLATERQMWDVLAENERLKRKIAAGPSSPTPGERHDEDLAALQEQRNRLQVALEECMDLLLQVGAPPDASERSAGDRNHVQQYLAFVSGGWKGEKEREAGVEAQRLRAELAAAQSEAARLTAQHRAACEEADALRSRLLKLESEAAADRATFKSEMEAAQSRIKGLEGAVQADEAFAARLQEHVTTAEREARGLHQRLEAKEQELENVKRQNAALDEQRRAWEEKTSNRERRTEELESALVATEERYTARVGHLEKELHEKNNDISRLHRQVGALKEQLQRLEDKDSAVTLLATDTHRIRTQLEERRSKTPSPLAHPTPPSTASCKLSPSPCRPPLASHVVNHLPRGGPIKPPKFNTSPEMSATPATLSPSSTMRDILSLSPVGFDGVPGSTAMSSSSPGDDRMGMPRVACWLSPRHRAKAAVAAASAAAPHPMTVESF